MKKTISMSTALFLVTSCAAHSEGRYEQYRIVNSQQACAEDARAYVKEANLDSIADPAVEQDMGVRADFP